MAVRADAMTLDQLKTEIRVSYEGHDRERMEWALAQLDLLLAARSPAQVKPDNPMAKCPSPHGAAA